MAFIKEADLENATLEWLAELGYATAYGPDINPEGQAPERIAYADVFLKARLKDAIQRINPQIPQAARDDALQKITDSQTQSLREENRRSHKLITEGVGVEFHAQDGTIQNDFVRLVDFDNPKNNDWLAVNQFTVIEGKHHHRADIVIFVNGMPLAVIELKNPGDENATLTGAYNQLQTYKSQIPSLFRTNAILVTSDGINARVGSLTASLERFMPWRTIDGKDINKSLLEMDTLTRGIFEPSRFLDLIRDFIVFRDADTKIIAGYHQFHAVREAVARTLEATAQEGDRKVGVIWHTQGSGKSLLMAFYAGKLARHQEMQNPTIIVITDRNDLDDQLFNTFAECQDLIRQTPIQAESRDDLKEKLNRTSGGVIFTTIQKFTPESDGAKYLALTDRRNVVVIADEAHRSQYGFGARVERKTGDIAYGFAKHMRDALPHASFIGFTGTPIENDDVNTPAVFGDYIDIYDISRGVEDGTTVKIYYESRLARIQLPEEDAEKIDSEMDMLTEDEEDSEQERIKQKWSTVEKIVGAEDRLKMIADDLVQHFEARVKDMDGKAMIVCMSRRICVALYREIIALRPDWHSDDDMKGAVKIVMTGSASDPRGWQPHIRNKTRQNQIAKRAKNIDDPLKIVIVRDMWLTGFDAPPMHTMYIDKPMRGHGLMQAIARVNRVFRDKEGGLIVDYIGIAQNLKNALGQYSDKDRQHAGIDQAEAVAVMLEKYEIVKAMFHGFDYMSGLTGTSQERLIMIADAIDWVLGQQREAAEKETTEDNKARAHRRFRDAVLALSKAFALAAASDEAKEIRDEVGLFRTICAALIKSSSGDGISTSEREFAIQQIINQAVASTEIVDILAAAGFKVQNISILSEEFLAEVRLMKQKNLALEALKKLLNDEIRSRSQLNIIEARIFSERLKDAIARYHTNAISTVEVLKELIDLAQDVMKSHRRGEEEGLSQQELAFFDALADNQSAVDVMGNDSLKVIAHEILKSLQGHVTIDWSHRESARARMRNLVRNILRKHGYPPDLQDLAVQTVLQQAEALAKELTTKMVA